VISSIPSKTVVNVLLYVLYSDMNWWQIAFFSFEFELKFTSVYDDEFLQDQLRVSYFVNNTEVKLCY